MSNNIISTPFVLLFSIEGHGIVLCRGAWQGSGGIGLLTLFTLLQLQIDANGGSSTSDEDKRAPIISSCLYHSSTLQAGLSDMCQICVACLGAKNSCRENVPDNRLQPGKV